CFLIASALGAPSALTARRDDATVSPTHQSAVSRSPLTTICDTTTTTLPVGSHQSPLPFGTNSCRPSATSPLRRPSITVIPPFPQLPIDRPSLPSLVFTLRVIVDPPFEFEPQVLISLRIAIAHHRLQSSIHWAENLFLWISSLKHTPKQEKRRPDELTSSRSSNMTPPS
ncbi:hypothetical protein HAX54_036867, partial [Datura stramonium]|nr:hypothetical protein [Datura stramonium]